MHAIERFQSLLQTSSPVIMGILNVTPDSFSDGGRYVEVHQALDQAEAMLEAGAAIIDIGGESTRPNAAKVGVEEELARVIPVIDALIKQAPDAFISIDTSKPEVMRAAVGAGASMINDVRALQSDGAVQAAVSLKVPVCLMHMQGEPDTMQAQPSYQDVVAEVKSFLLERCHQCEAAGISRAALVIDPGFGFGKTLEHNLSLIKHFSQLVALGYPVMAGLSRKSMFAHLLGLDVQDRVVPSVVGAAFTVLQGASVVRVHDVAETRQAVQMLQAIAAAE